MTTLLSLLKVVLVGAGLAWLLGALPWRQKPMLVALLVGIFAWKLLDD